MRKRTLLLLLGAALLTGCSLPAGLPSPGTATPFIITATLPPTPIPSITPTPVPPTPTPTTVPVEGMTGTQVNVRATPSTAGTQLGILPPFTRVQIVGKDAGGNWYMILYPDAPDGAGWVTAQYVSVIQGQDKIPVVGGLPTQPSPAEGTPGAGPGGVILQQVNVRAGPGTAFDALGTLNPNDAVTLTGRDPTGDWLQIRYTGAPGGLGWIAAAYVDASGTQDLPIVGAAGAEPGATTPAPPPILSPTPGAALDDHDSAQAPGASASLSPSGTRAFIYSSDLSAPQGDAQDWVQLTSSSPAVLISLACSGNSGLAVQLTQGGGLVPGWQAPACGETRAAQLAAGSVYLLDIALAAGHPTPAYVRYSLRLEASG